MKLKHQIKYLIVGMFLTSFTWAAPPATPTLYISPNGQKIQLYWDEVTGAERYKLFVSDLTTGASLGEFDMGDTNRLSVTAPVGNSYFISVRAENADGESAYSIPRQLVVSAEDNTPTLAQVVQNYARTVVYNTYSDLADRAAKLNTAIIKLRFDTTEENLAAAQHQWVNTRRPWEQSEAFLFGPVDTEGLDPALDSWPVNATDLQNVLDDSGTELTVETVSEFNDDLKGFHVIEFLLFGTKASKTSADLTDRELAYLGAAASVMANDTHRLAQAWNPTDGNFLAEFAQADVGTASYPTVSAAVTEMIEGMVGIADEVASIKLEQPIRFNDATRVESQFSLNSRADFMDNIRAIRNAYTGNYLLSEGPGLNAYVKSVNPDLDETINNQIEAAIVAIDSIPQPFADAITNDPDAVQTAIDAVNVLLVILSEQLPTVVQ